MTFWQKSSEKCKLLALSVVLGEFSCGDCIVTCTVGKRNVLWTILLTKANANSRSIHCTKQFLNRSIADTYLWLDSSHNFCENLLVAKQFTCSNKRIFHWNHPRDVRCNLAMHCSVTPFIIRQPIRRPCLLERVYKPIHTPHWERELQSFL